MMARPREFDIDTVLRQCMRVFWEQGYLATSMEDLMQATGLSKQSFYCAFGDKHALFLKAVTLYKTESFAVIKSALGKSDSAFENIQNLLRTLVVSSPEEAKGCLMVNTALEFGAEDPEIYAELQSMFAGFEKFIEQAILRGQEQGEITKRFSSQLMSKSLINTVGGLRILEKRGESSETIQAILEMALTCIRV